MIQSIPEKIPSFSIFTFQLEFLYVPAPISWTQSSLVQEFIMFAATTNGFHCDLILFRIGEFDFKVIGFEWWDSNFADLLHWIQIVIF